MITNIASNLLTHKDLSFILEKDFPNNDLLYQIKKKLSKFNGRDKQSSHKFMKTRVLQLRNIVKLIMKPEIHKEMIALMQCIDQENLKNSLRSWIEMNIPVLLKQYIRKTSLLLTKRAKWIIRKKANYFPASWRDQAIRSILKGKKLTLKDWDAERKKWRDSFLIQLEKDIKKLDLQDMVDLIVTDSLNSITSTSIIKNLFNSRIKRSRILGISWNSFKDYLQSELKIQAEKEMMKDLKDRLLTTLRKSLEQLRDNPSKWINKPSFKKQTISFAFDDGQVYNINYDNHDKVQVNLSFRPRRQLPCFLETSDRFFTMIKRGFKPFRGTLTKENGRKLILTIPFGKKHEENPKSDNLMAAGLDLGVKTFGVLSIAPIKKDNDGRVQSIGAEIKNYFIDQKQLQGSRDAWLQKIESKLPPFNYKRRLTNLQALSYGLQSKMDRYKQAHPKNYRNKIKYYKLKKEFKRVWKKIQNLHGELAKQVATRVIAACQHHNVSILNVEDLSWSKPGRKQEVGYFLKTWQVHWFHGRIQEILISRARQEGISVKKVNARNTSKRCSSCGTLGNRSGKRFTCPHCGFKLDSDLNAARNILKVPFPRNHVSRGRVPVLTQSIS